MTAKEMFEALGYKVVKNGNTIECSVRHGDSARFTILFLLKEKRYVKLCFTDRDIMPNSISVEEHIAITQQMKELGWLE